MSKGYNGCSASPFPFNLSSLHLLSPSNDNFLFMSEFIYGVSKKYKLLLVAFILLKFYLLIYYYYFLRWFILELVIISPHCGIAQYKEK